VPYRHQRGFFVVFCYLHAVDRFLSGPFAVQVEPPFCRLPLGMPERKTMSKRLFVGNLSYDTSESQLQTAFAPYGGTGATIPTDYDGRGKGFGFVDVEADQMNSAISAMNGKEIGGRACTVNEARPRTERSGSGGSGGGYNGGGRSGGNRW
jgi:RNA recognition motif-containing protein